MTNHVDPEKQQFAALFKAGREGPVQMLNLVRCRKRVVYPSGERATGAEAYATYGKESAPIFTRVGGKIVWRGEAPQIVIGPMAERWDIAFIAQYPSIEAFGEMVQDPDYQKIVRHRQLAVENSPTYLSDTRQKGQRILNLSYNFRQLYCQRYCAHQHVKPECGPQSVITQKLYADKGRWKKNNRG